MRIVGAAVRYPRDVMPDTQPATDGQKPLEKTMSEHGTRTAPHVIAIGASAGGLEACRALLKDMPRNAPAAFILILHLDPKHDSMMVDLLSRHTRLTVVQAAEGMRLEPGHLYVIPPGVFLTVAEDVLHLSEPDDGKSVRLPFDVLLRSLSTDAPTRSGCVVLSGTGTDGTMGLADLHAAGGMVIAQDPKEADYPGMPESAIATGLVARILRAGQIAAELEKFWKVTPGDTPPAASQMTGPGKKTARHSAATASSEYDDLLAFMGEHSTQDITLYKRGTLQRRIARRMALAGLRPDDTVRYLEILQSDPEERAQLSVDVLIHVTSFFRDPAVFDHLSTKAIPGLLKDLPEDRPLRIWIAGCSTGEEAYSLAIICKEVMDASGYAGQLQILASDVDPEAIATARAGFYSMDIESVVSPERLERFFVQEDGGYRVTLALRDMIVFTIADLLSDPPFSRIDLVSCRNVLIYLGPEAQKRVIARCCFALRRGGLLLLGTAEMPGQSDGCFAIEDKAARLWRRIGQSHPGDLHFAIGKREEEAAATGPTPVRRTALADICRRIVLDNYAPAAALLNARLEVLYLLGPTERYLKVTQGHPDPGIVGMLPKSLRGRFRAAADSCVPGNPKVTLSGGHIPGSGAFNIALHAVAAGSEPLLLACFIDAPRPASGVARAGGARGEGRETGELEADLEALRSDLSDALRNLEEEVEAHSADAAEALSVNEEFQSTNEELLASKEELQSLNEELTALNSQLQETLERHRTIADDLRNVLFSTDVATLFLDLDLNIRFFTPNARAIFHVIPTDVGRPLADLASDSSDDDLAADARCVLESFSKKEREIKGKSGAWFMRCIQPYRTDGGQIEGVVITYANITERKRINAKLRATMDEAHRATRAKSRFLAAASHDLRQPLQSMGLLHALLARQKRSAEGARLATLMDQTLKSMTAMLDSMLNLNRIESGIIRPEIQRVALDPLLKRLVVEFGPQSELKGLELRSVPCTAWVRTDPQLLEQMLRNLLSNALKYTLKGRVLLGCRRRGGLASIVVCDTGVGISPSEIEAIFDSYRRGEKASALASAGLGLGLSIVQRLGQLLEHPVTVRSSLGRGSTFAITLPVADPLPQIVAPPQQETGLTGAARQTGRILLVEDEEPLRELLAEVLTQEGHIVVATAEAKEALTWASGDMPVPDLVLTDFDLHGGISGLRLAQDLLDILGEPVPTIILTGDITSATHKRIAASPFRQVVKPVMPEILLAQISDMMLRARTAKTTKAARADASATSVHVIDDDPMIREAMHRLFEAEGWTVVTYASAEDFLAVPRPEGAACLLVDNLLPGMDGVSLVRRLQAQNSRLPVVMLTAHGDAAVAVAAMKAGASDMIEKPASAADLLVAVRRAIGTKGDGRTRAATRKAAQDHFADLTAREREVLARVLNGDPNKIIAADLAINQRTVENHRASVMRKTGAASLPALVRLAIAAGLQSA